MNKQSRADFRYRVVQDNEDIKLLLIVDENLGGRSVTNDIENVLADICELEDSDPLDYYPIAYRDSEGRWDSWDPETEDFRVLSEEEKQTIQPYITLL
jgi:hypothetical protein